MTSPDPADLRLLSLLAESGKAAIHELAGRLGMDPREAATRLVSLSATGLPLIVGAECDQQRLRAFVSQQQLAQQQAQFQQQPYQQGAQPYAPSGAYPVAGAPYPPQSPVMGTPSGAYPVAGTPSGPYPAYPPANAPYPAPAAAQTPPSAGVPAQPSAQDPISTWGLPQSASWARGDQQQEPAPSATTAGKVGDKLSTTGLGGEPITVHLIEVVDPADFLFSAAGYSLGANERCVVVHTELTNNGPTPYNTLPDLYLVLYTSEGHSIGKAPISLASRPPHAIGVAPGETVGGHAVYVINERSRILEIRWLTRPDSTENSLTWEIT